MDRILKEISARQSLRRYFLDAYSGKKTHDLPLCLFSPRNLGAAQRMFLRRAQPPIPATATPAPAEQVEAALPSPVAPPASAGGGAPQKPSAAQKTPPPLIPQGKAPTTGLIENGEECIVEDEDDEILAQPAKGKEPPLIARWSFAGWLKTTGNAATSMRPSTPWIRLMRWF